MFAYRIWLCGLMLVATSLSSAQAKPEGEYPLCQTLLAAVGGGPDWAAVGDVPNLPFTALAEEGLRKIQSDGSRVALATPDSPAGLVVRDSGGRVMVASRIKTTHEAEGNFREWWETICDPAKGTVTTIKYRATASSSDTDIPNGPDAYLPIGAQGTAWIRDDGKGYTTSLLAAFHRVVDGRDNLGAEMFEGLPAYRYRLTRTHTDRSLHEVVISDQLFLNLAFITWKTYPEIEDEIHLTKIYLGEPREALFDLPQSLHVDAARPRP
jgi:hypothetical protein